MKVLSLITSANLESVQSAFGAETRRYHVGTQRSIGNSNYLKGIFMNELKEETRAELRLHSLRTLEELMDLAVLVEPRNMILRCQQCAVQCWKRKGIRNK